MLNIIIVNWNAGAQLIECVKSIPSGHNIIVVDNASSDGSEKAIAGLSNIELICLDENIGFGRACNLGATRASGDFLLFLNPDAALYPNTLQTAISFIRDERNANVGICGVQLINDVGEITRHCAFFPTPWRLAGQTVGLDRIFPALGHFMSKWDHCSTREVDQVIGAFFLVRNSLFNALNGFDERFFVYMEDLDFCYRAKLAGWSSVYLANTNAFHSGNGTTKNVKARRLFYSLRSRLVYAHKHFSFGGLILVTCTTLFVEPFSRSALALGRRSWSMFCETWAGYAYLYRWLPQWIILGRTR